MHDTQRQSIAISALQHWSYCPRQCALIHTEQVFADNVYTARGNAAHTKVDQPGAERTGTVRLERAMPLWSDRLGLIGRADLVEFEADGSPYPIEYKHGPRRQHKHDDLQLAAQAMCLEEMTGKAVPLGAIYHFSSRHRREVEITQSLRTDVEHATQQVRALLAAGKLPPPVNDARCRHCSLKEICQPQAMAARNKYKHLLEDLHQSP